METVGDIMEDWIKKWKQELSWQERWDVNGWGRKPKPKTVINLDDIYEDGKLFGQDIYYNPADDRIPCFDVIKNNRHYVFSVLWNWEKYHLVLCCFTIVKAIPYRARREIGFDIMFSLKDGLLQNLIDTEIENLISTIENLINNDKKDNRNS